MEQNWRSPTGGSDHWQSTRYRPNPNHRNFGYGQQNEAGRFRSPPYSRSPRQNFNPNRSSSPRYIGGYSNFNNSYSSSPISQQQYRQYHRPQQQYRQFSPRGGGYYNQGGPRRDKNNIENWIHPEMWSDPWAHLDKVQVAEEDSSKMDNSNNTFSDAPNDDDNHSGLPTTDNENSQVMENSPIPPPQSSTNDDDSVQLTQSETTDETGTLNIPDETS